MKKYVAMLLCATFVIPTVPAYAETKEEQSVFIEAACKNTNTVELTTPLEVNNANDYSETLEMQLVNYYALPKENIDSFYENGDGYTFYGENRKGVKTEGTIRVADDGTIYLDIQEGNLKDEVVLSSDGKIYLDGKEVTYSIEYDGLENNTTQISRAVTRASDQWQTETCPYGKASDYSDKKISLNSNWIKLEKSIGVITETALKTVVLGIGASFASGAGMPTVTLFIVYDIIDLIKDLAEVWGDSDQILSKVDVFYHKDGHVVGTGLTVQKEKQYWSIKTDEGTKTSTLTVYNCQQFY